MAHTGYQMGLYSNWRGPTIGLPWLAHIGKMERTNVQVFLGSSRNHPDGFRCRSLLRAQLVWERERPRNTPRERAQESVVRLPAEHRYGLPYLPKAVGMRANPRSAPAPRLRRVFRCLRANSPPWLHNHAYRRASLSPS